MPVTTREVVLTQLAASLAAVAGTVDRQYQDHHSADIEYPFINIVDVHADHEFICHDLAFTTHTVILAVGFEPTDDALIATELNAVLDDIRNAIRQDSDLNSVLEHLFEMGTEVNENMQEGQANVYIQVMLTYVEDFST